MYTKEDDREVWTSQHFYVFLLYIYQGCGTMIYFCHFSSTCTTTCDVISNPVCPAVLLMSTSIPFFSLVSDIAIWFWVLGLHDCLIWLVHNSVSGTWKARHTILLLKGNMWFEQTFLESPTWQEYHHDNCQNIYGFSV